MDLTLEVRAGALVVGRDMARLKVAPWVMSHHQEPTKEAWTADFGALNAPYRRTESASPGYVGLDHSGPLREVGGIDRGTQWFQDHGEFGYTGFPDGPRTTVFFRLPYFRGNGVPQPFWPKTRLLKADVGTFQLGVNLGAGAGDYGGNLEVTHPTPAHPLGRVMLGSTGSAALFTFLQSQDVQEPFRLDTSWLTVSHLDETFMFTHTPNQVVVASPARAFELMEAVPPQERGRAVLFATGADPVSGVVKRDGEPTVLHTGIDHTKGPRWGWVRLYDSSATGSGAAGQIARIAPDGLQNGYLVVNRVYNSTSNVVGPRGGNHHMEWALVRDIPNRTTWYNVPRAGDQFVLLEETRQWASPFGHAPAAITVHEALRDPYFRTLNQGDVQGRIDAAMAALEQAVGGPGSLQFVPVPTLFLGRLDERDGITARSAVAYTPGLANVAPLAGGLYFARQFGFRDAAGRDVFEHVTRAALPEALFADDWDLYHRLLGEVHCGVVVRSDPVDPQWWYYQP